MKKLICIVLVLVMVLAMTSCADTSKAIYKAAVLAYEAGMYESAGVAFGSLDDFEDSAAYLATINAKKLTAEASNIVDDPATEENEVDAEKPVPVVSNVEFVYQNDNVVKEVITHNDGTVTKNYYKYDDLGNCTSETINHPDGTKTTYSHHFDGNVKLRTIRINPNNSQETFEYAHDENGRIMFHEARLADGTLERGVYYYNDKGRLYYIVTTSGNITAYKYNAFGHLTKVTVSNNGTALTSTSYEYEYECSVK